MRVADIIKKIKMQRCKHNEYNCIFSSGPYTTHWNVYMCTQCGKLFRKYSNRIEILDEMPGYCKGLEEGILELQKYHFGI